MIEAVIFDLDGVITDTAEYHFRSWKRLAEDESIPFTRADNEKLRGVSRRESLRLMLAGREISKDQAEEWMERKNRYYQEMIANLTQDDLLPGVTSLLEELQGENIKVGIASASRNAPAVIARLGIEPLLDGCADGNSIERQKPAPDLFLYAARMLDVPPSRCLVVEDAASGIQAAQAAGMVTVGLGPVERVGEADLVLSDLEGVRVADLTRAATWMVTEASYKSDRQHHHETIFTQGNGYLGTRGTLEERVPEDRQATFVHGMWDDVPIVFTELVNAPDWTAFEVWINGQRISMDQEKVVDYARILDLRRGILWRRLRWEPGEGQQFELTFERFPSLEDPHVMALRVQLHALGGPATVEMRASIDGHVENEGRLHWEHISQRSSPESAFLVLKTRSTQKILAMSTRLSTIGAKVSTEGRDCRGNPGVSIQTELKKGETITVDKYVSIYTSRDIDNPLEAAQRKVNEAATSGYESLRAVHEASWGEFWSKRDVIIEGDDDAQLAIRHALYQLRIAASSEDEHVSIGAKTLSGFGYRGHVFWDNEIFVIPFFTYTNPKLSRNMLMYRWHTIDGARSKAADNGFGGAQYAWESAETGEEVTPRWVPDWKDPTSLIRIWTGDIQIHISADIAYAIWQYWQVTGDDKFMCNFGAPIILETAVFWGERVEREGDRYVIHQVIGPDEYHTHVDNSAFTNGMVGWHLSKAIELREWLHEVSPTEAEELDQRIGITPDQLDLWRDIAAKLKFHMDPTTGLIEQFDNFFQLPDVEWEKYEGRTESMQSLLGIEGANNHQVLKQADVIMLLCLLRDQFDTKTWKANWDYYHPRTDHEYGSSLSPSIHAWAACELGQPDVAYDHFVRAARADLQDIRGNAGHGIHAASAGGLWQALVFGFAGLQLTDNGFKINPQLPSHWKRLAFRLCLRGEWQEVDVKP